MLYLTRRLTGSLIFAMLLHGIWDFSGFLGKAATFTTIFPLVTLVFGLVLVFILLGKEKGARIPQVGVPAGQNEE